MMNTSVWDGTISSSDFYSAACTFVQRWKTINFAFPSWSWIPCQKLRWIKSDKVEGYLSLEKVCLLKPHENELEKGELFKETETASYNNEEFLDGATSQPQVIIKKYITMISTFCTVRHIVFQCYTFELIVVEIPANGNDFPLNIENGQLLTFEEIEKDLPSQPTNVLLDSKWTFITHEEHPYLNRPWYKLHPCGTSEWIKLLFLSDTSRSKNGIPIERYLASWLSVVGQVVGLRIPIEMWKDGCQL